MSRVGKMPVTIPAGVDVSFQENKINVTLRRANVRAAVQTCDWPFHRREINA